MDTLLYFDTGRCRALQHNAQRNNDAPPPCSLAQHPSESTIRRLTRTDRILDAAGFGRTQQLITIIGGEPLLHEVKRR
jgi:hypothetical protein